MVMGTKPEVSLRHVELSDVDRLLAWMGDERVSFISSSDARRSGEELQRDYLGSTVRLLPHPWLRAICAQGELVGYLSVTPRSGRKRCRGRGLRGIARECWGREAAPAAVGTATVEVSAEFPQLKRPEVLLAAENAAGQSVMDRVGFVKEAIRRRFHLGENVFGIGNGTAELVSSKENRCRTVSISRKIYVERFHRFKKEEE